MKQLLNFILVFLIAFMQVPLANAQFTPAQEQALEIEYLKNGGFENGVSGWKAYKDAAQATLVDATGGTPAISIASSTSSPIQGKASGVITKTASNLQGEGISKAFTLDKSMRGKVVRITGSYEIVSGTYSGGTPSTDSDVVVGIYDVDAGAYIQPSAYKLDGAVTGITYPINVEFQPRNLTSVNYRLAFHVATTSASAYSLKIDEIKIGKHKVVSGSPVTATISWTPQAVALTSGTITNATSTGTYSRNGDRAKISTMTVFSSTSSAFSGFRLNLPPGCSLDTSKIANDALLSKSLSSAVTVMDSGVSHYGIAGKVKAISGETAYVEVVWSTTNYAQAAISNTSPFTFAGGDSVSTDFEVPCVGWSSNVTMSDSAATRPVAAKYSLTSDETTAANSDHIMTNFTTKVYDTFGAMSGSRFTAPVPGFYKVRLKALTNNHSWTTSDIPSAYLAKNGSSQAEFLSRQRVQAAFTDRIMLFGETSVELNAGEYIEINIRNATAGTVPVIFAGLSFFEVEMIQGPSQIFASEEIGMRWGGSTTGGLTSGSTVSIVMNTKVYDLYNMYNSTTGEITIPVSGRYRCTFKTHINSYASSSIGGGVQLSFQKNGAGEYLVWSSSAKTTSAVSHTDVTSGELDLLAGDKLIPRFFHGMGGAGVTLQNGAEYTWVSCVKVK